MHWGGACECACFQLSLCRLSSASAPAGAEKAIQACLGHHPSCGRRAGLTAVGVSLVVSAASSLARGICVGTDQQLITTVSAAIAFYYQAAWIYPALILAGALGLCQVARGRKISCNGSVKQG